MKKTKKIAKTFFLLISFAVAGLITFQALSILQRNRRQQQQMTFKQGKSLARLTAAAISLNLESAGQQLQLLAKFRELTSFKKQTLLAPRIEKIGRDFDFAADALAMDIAVVYEQQSRLAQSFKYWQELVEALVRRFRFELFHLGGIIPMAVDFDQETENETPTPDPDLPTPDFERISKPDFYRQTRWTVDMIYATQKALRPFFARLSWAGAQIERFIDLGNTVLANQIAAEKFLSLAFTNRRWFSGLRIVNLYGLKIVDFSETGINKNLVDRAICQKFVSGKNFWLKNVSFDEKERAYLQMAVPLKDRKREVCGAIRGALNLETIKELLSSAQIGTESELILLERDFNTIMSSNSGRKVNQISFIKTLVGNKAQPSLNSAGNYYFDPENHRDIFVVPLSNFRKDHLPDWQIALVQERPEKGHYSFIISEPLLFVLAVVGLYVLFYSAVHLSKLYFQDMFA